MGDSHLSAPPRTDAGAAEASLGNNCAANGGARSGGTRNAAVGAGGWARRQRLAAGAVLAFAVLIAVTAYGYGLRKGDQPGPGLFPFIVGSLLTLLAAVWMFKPGRPEAEQPVELVTSLLGEAEQDAAGTQPGEEIDWGHGGALRFGVTLLCTAVAVVLFVSLGYTIAVAFYTAALLTVVAGRKPVWSVIGAVLGAMVTRALFDYLGVVLPSLQVRIPFLPWTVI